MKQKISSFLVNAVKLPLNIRFKVNNDGTILHQDDPEDDTTFYVYIESIPNPELYDGLRFSKYQNPVEVLKKIEKIVGELKDRI